MAYTKVTQDRAIELVRRIIESENNKYGLDIKFISLSLKDRVKELMKHDNFVINKVTDYIYAYGIYKYVRNTIAYYDFNLDTISLIKDKKILFTSLDKFNKAEMIETAYHEYFHALDKDRVYQFYDYDCPLDNIDFGFFFSIVEDIIWPLEEVQEAYRINPTGFMCEIQADLYGIENTLSKHNVDSKSVYLLKKFNSTLLERYDGYDSDFFLENLYKYYINNYDSDFFSSQIFDVFYKNGSYKRIDAILNDSRVVMLDKRILNSILLCPSFLNTMVNGNYSLNSEQYKYLFSLLDDEIIRLNDKLDSKRKLNEDDSIDYYFKIVKRSAGKVYSLIRQNSFINERILNPIFKNSSIKDKYKKSIIDDDEEKIKLLKNVYDVLMNNYYNANRDFKNR